LNGVPVRLVPYEVVFDQALHVFNVVVRPKFDGQFAERFDREGQASEPTAEEKL
jgi:hypothetical protein